MDIYDFLTESIQTEYTTVKVLKDSQRSKITLVRHKKTGRPFVFRQFTGDAAVCRRLIQTDCRHLPQIYEVGEQDGRVAVLEEYIQGDNLAELLETGLFSEKEVRKIAGEILEGLQVLHALGAVHRDIKPENVLLRETGAVLIDFDASRVYKEAQASDTHILGTTGYAAPEQFGVTQTDHRADIYAMGILMNIMLTGKHPSKAMATGRMGKIISRCTMIDPGKRYRNVDRLLRALERKPHQVIIPTFLSLLLIGALALIPIRNRTAPELPAESPLPSAAVTAEPSPEKTPSPVPTPTPESSPEPALPTETATYTDEDGTYHLFLCYDAPMISRRNSQKDRSLTLPEGIRTNVPSILSAYKEGSDENAGDDFLRKVENFSLEAIPMEGAGPMNVGEFVMTDEFAGSLKVSFINMGLDCRRNTIRWTLTMVNGQKIVLEHTITVEESKALVITPDNQDMSTLEQLQQVIDTVPADDGSGPPVEICLPPVTYEGDLYISGRGITLIGNPYGTTLKGTITANLPGGEWVTLQTIAMEGNGGTGITANSPVTLYDCTLSGYQTAAAAHDAGWITARNTIFRNNELGLLLDSSWSPHVDVCFSQCEFEENGTAVRILSIPSNIVMTLPGTVFLNNSQDIDNQINYPVDMSEAILEPIR